MRLSAILLAAAGITLAVALFVLHDPTQANAQQQYKPLRPVVLIGNPRLQ